MSTHNIGFYEDLTEIIFELSSKRTLFLLLYDPCEKIVLRVSKQLQRLARVEILDKETTLNRFYYPRGGIKALVSLCGSAASLHLCFLHIQTAGFLMTTQYSHYVSLYLLYLEDLLCIHHNLFMTLLLGSKPISVLAMQSVFERE